MAKIEHSELWEEFKLNRESPEVFRRLVDVHLPLVHQIAARVAINLPSHVLVEDLLQIGVVGLCGAIERFDPDYGVSFGAYAQRRIKGAILDELRNSDHISRVDRMQIKKMEDVAQEWTNTHGRPPSEQELADELGITTADLGGLLDSAHPWLSLDQVIIATKGGQEVFLRDVIEDGNVLGPDLAAERQDMRIFLRNAFRQLSTREQKILYLYYFEDLRLVEIAEIFELTEARICQIHALALIKLRSLIDNYCNRPGNPQKSGR